MKTLSILLALSFVACTPPPVVPTSGSLEDEAAIRATLANWTTEWNVRNIDALVAMLAEDWNEVYPNGTHVSSKVEAAELLTTEFAETPAEVQMTAELAFIKWIGPDNAVAGGTFAVIGSPPGMPDHGSMLLTLRRTEIGWLFTTGIGAVDYQPVGMSIPVTAD